MGMCGACTERRSARAEEHPQDRARELDRKKAEDLLRSLSRLSVLLDRDGLKTLSRYLALLS